MTTPNEIIVQALKKSGVLGVGQQPLAEDINDAFLDLNDMLAQYQRKRWLIWHLIDTAFTSTGVQSYTVGPGGNFNIPRPDRIEAAYFRQIIPSQPNLIDYPLKLIQAREEYSLITLKTLVSFPEWIFYDSAYPVGSVFPWPLMQAGLYELHIIVKESLTKFANLATPINLPPEYEPMLKWNLAARLRVSYQLPEDPQVTALASDSLNLIRNANTQIPSLKMPAALVKNGGVYNIYSDQTR